MLERLQHAILRDDMLERFLVHKGALFYDFDGKKSAVASLKRTQHDLAVIPLAEHLDEIEVIWRQAFAFLTLGARHIHSLDQLTVAPLLLLVLRRQRSHFARLPQGRHPRVSLDTTRSAKIARISVCHTNFKRILAVLVGIAQAHGDALQYEKVCRL